MLTNYYKNNKLFISTSEKKFMKVFKHLVSANKGVSLVLLACFMAQPVLSTEKQIDPQIDTKKKVRSKSKNLKDWIIEPIKNKRVKVAPKRRDFSLKTLKDWDASIRWGKDFGKIFIGSIKIFAPHSLADNFARCLFFQYSGGRRDELESLKLCEAFSKLLTDTFGEKGVYEGVDKEFLEAYSAKDAHERFPAFFRSLKTLQDYRAPYSKTAPMSEAESNKNEFLTKDTLDKLREIEAVRAASLVLRNFQNSKNRHDNIEKNTKRGRKLSCESDIFLGFQKDHKDLSEKLLEKIRGQPPLVSNRTYNAKEPEKSCRKYRTNEACLTISFLKELKETLTENRLAISEFEARNSVKFSSESGLTMSGFLKQLSTHIGNFENRNLNDKSEYAQSIYNEMKDKGDSFIKLNRQLKEQFYQYINFEESDQIIKLMKIVPLLNILLAANRSQKRIPGIRMGKSEFEKFIKFVSSKTRIPEMTKKEQDAVKATPKPILKIQRKRDLKATEKQGTRKQRPSIAVAPTSQRPDGQATFHMVEDNKRSISKEDFPNLNKRQKLSII